MRRMADSKSDRGAVQMIDTAMSVERHQKDHVGCWRPLRCLIESMIPYCGFHSMNNNNNNGDGYSAESMITGTIFGYRKRRVNFCVQKDPDSPPLLLLEFAVSTDLLAKEMEHGLLRVALECQKQNDDSLLSAPVWTMYCNGRRVGFAVRRHPTDCDLSILNVMRCIFVGAGRILRRRETAEGDGDEGDLMYMRANYRRVIDSSDSQSFHLINPDGTTRQELSIFLLRSS